ncbi:helix-turn-helix domain-containing protein [Nocardiopsis sp. FR26]|uniref:helix-turn-helix domain-containing protein n=1 Tax=Nocardiopsis sp. FR26 TaxID=2605987 RepID=UPI00135C7102|nr:helix-turn-helix domain-containing protein [Nocardiopsis sp. FR26]
MSSVHTTRFGECACCGVVGPLTSRGLSRSCHRRYQRVGELGEWPTRDELIEEDIRMVVATGVSYQVVAARCGVAERTVLRVVSRWGAAGWEAAA